MVDKFTQRLLVVETDASYSKRLAAAFMEKGFEVDLAAGALDLFSLWDYQRYDLVLLAFNLADEDGLVALRKLRQRDDLPVFMLMDEENNESLLAALEMGADDVISKKSLLEALVLRVGNCLDRLQGLQNPVWKNTKRVWRFSDWRLEEATRLLVHAEGRQLQLTRAEFDLLLALVKAESRPLSKMQLSDAVGRGNLDTSPETIAVLIHRLRKKLGCKQVIQTLSGVGYRIQESQLMQ